MKDFTFSQFKKIRKDILSAKHYDFVSYSGENNVIISAPHGVSQLRLGKLKCAEIGTIPVAVLVAQNTKSNLILKTQNLYDDANFDSVSKYRDAISNIIKQKNCKFLFDIHGMAKTRDCDINLGINFGQNIAVDRDLFDKLVYDLESAGFSVSVDQPFAAGQQTICGSFSKKYEIFTVQIEINCDITNNSDNIVKCNRLVSTLVDFIASIEK